MQRFIILIATVLMVTSVGLGYEKSKALNLPVDDAEAIIVNVHDGDLSIEGHKDLTEIKVSATLKIDGSTESTTPDLLDNALEVALDNRNGTVYLRSAFDKEKAGFTQDQDIQVELRVDIPSTLRLNVDNRNGTTEIQNIYNDLTVKDGAGYLHVKDVLGHVNINDGLGDLFIESVGGKLVVNDTGGEIRIERINGDVAIRDGLGNIATKWVHGDVNVTDGSGKISVAEITGDLDILENQDGKVRIAGVKGNVRNVN